MTTSRIVWFLQILTALVGIPALGYAVYGGVGLIAASLVGAGCFFLLLFYRPI